MPTDLDVSTARRIALAAQGFSAPRPRGKVTREHLRKVLGHVGLIQIDSVNVLVRSQELPLFSRLGKHSRSLIPDATADGELFEYWGHEAAHIPTEHHHLFRWRMAEAGTTSYWKYWMDDLDEFRPNFLDEVLERVKSDGPLVAGDVRTRTGPKGTWWDWDHGKRALELLFYRGDITATRRPKDFARVYDIASRTIPSHALARQTPSDNDARRELLRLASRSLGVATLKDLADYYRQKPTVCRPLVEELVASGELSPVRVQGWKEPAFLARDAVMPRKVNARALLSPFDSLVWFRPRVERLFDFVYRIEIYVPEPQRVYGYYVLPFLLGEQLVARVDLKADRQQGVLRVNGAFGEKGIDVDKVADALADELSLMADWLGLSDVVIGQRGNLSRQLKQHARRR